MVQLIVIVQLVNPVTTPSYLNLILPRESSIDAIKQHDDYCYTNCHEVPSRVIAIQRQRKGEKGAGLVNHEDDQEERVRHNRLNLISQSIN